MKITRTAQKQFRSLDAKVAKNLLEALKIYETTGRGDVKKLQGRDGFRLRKGSLRAIFDIENNEIVVLEVGVRGGIY